MVIDDDAVKIITSHVRAYADSTDTFLVNACLTLCFCVKQLFSHSLSRVIAFKNTLAYCEFTVKDAQLRALLERCVEKQLDHTYSKERIEEKPVEFAIYITFYCFVH